MPKKQQYIIFAILAMFFISIAGTAILIFVGGEDSSDNASEQLQEIEDRLAEQAQNQEDVQSAASECVSGASEPGDPIDPPKFDLPEGDINELKVKELVVGSGKEVEQGACIKAHYHGVLDDGTVFDSSYERGVPATFSLLQVIEGWQQGIVGMKEGGTRVLYIPSELAYGENGSAPVIGPNEDLVFVVQLLEVVE